MNIRVENWLGHEIRFVEKVPGEWWAVAADIAIALGYKHTPHMLRTLDPDEKDVHIMDTLGGKQKMRMISESGIYEAVFNSRRDEAKDFKNGSRKS